MSYSPTTWVAGVTKLGPTNLNHLEGGTQAAAAVADAATTAAAAAQATANAALPTPAGTNGQFLKKVGGVWVPTSFAVTDIPAASIDQTYMAAGNKVTTSLLSGGPPGSPTTGDIWIATAVDTGNLATTNGTRWAFQYNGSSGSASKWEFIGGTDIYVAVETEETTASAAYADLATVGPSFTFARAGDYDIGFGVEMFNDTATSPLQAAAIKRGAAATADADGLFGNTWTVANTVLSVSRSLKVSPAAADVYKLQYKTSAATAHFRKRWIRISPVRIT